MSFGDRFFNDRPGAPGRWVALGGAAVLAMLVPIAVAAQTVPSAAAAASPDDSGDSGDIIVTAQRREQRLQDVPIAVSAFDQSSLIKGGIADSAQLTQITPGLNFTQSAYYAQPTIRGVGSSNTHAGDESNVATYVDGVYISQMLGNFYKLNNIERIEVLKGPQGTLFGRNATGGAINIVTREPSEDTTMNAQLGFGRFNDIDASSFISGGITQDLLASVSLNYNQRDGYYENLARGGTRDGGRRSFAVRSKIRWNASDALRFLLIGDFSRSDDPNGIFAHTLNRNSAAEALGINTSSGDYQIAFPTLPSSKLKQKGVSLQADLELEPFSIVSVTAYRDTRSDGLVDSDGTAAPFLFFDQRPDIKDFSQEIRLVSAPSSKVQWVLGGFIYDNDALTDPLIVSGRAFGPPIFTLVSRQKTRAYAAFADVTIPLTEQLSITGGLRYSSERKRFSFNRTPALPTVPNGSRPRITEDSWTPRAVVSYKPNDDVLIYASYSGGFKSGGYNTVSPQDPPYSPETIDAFETGVKLTLARGVTLNAAAYHYDYNDLQVQALVGSGGTSSVSNAATAKMDGLDVEFNAQVTRAFTVRAGATYLRAKYDRWENASVFIPRVNGIPSPGNRLCVNASATGGINECDVSGRDVVRAPEYTLSIGGSYTAELGGDYRLTLSGNAFHSADFSWEPGGRVRQPSYELVNGQVELSLPGDHVTLSVWGRNLTNERVFTVVPISAIGDRAQFADPVTYGVTIRMNF